MWSVFPRSARRDTRPFRCGIRPNATAAARSADIPGRREARTRPRTISRRADSNRTCTPSPPARITRRACPRTLPPPYAARAPEISRRNRASRTFPASAVFESYASAAAACPLRSGDSVWPAIPPAPPLPWRYLPRLAPTCGPASTPLLPSSKPGITAVVYGYEPA